MQLFQALVDGSPDGVLVVEGDRIRLANRAAAALLGAATADELVGRSLLERLPLETRAILASRLAGWHAGEPGEAEDARIERPGRAPVVVSIAGAPFTYGAAPAVQLSLRDVTEHRRSERALREREEQLTLAVAGAEIGIWDWDLRSDAIQYSDRWKAMLGYTGDEIEPHVSAWERLVHPDDRVRADRAHESVARGERTTYEAEFRLRHKNGHYVHVLSRGFPIHREPGGPVLRIVGTHFDLTERKLAEAVLRENEERLKLAFAGAQEGVWDWNLETGAVLYSPRWKEMLGYSDDEIEPHVAAWERLLHPDDRARARQVHESVVNGAPTYEGEFRLRHKAGHYVTVLSRGYPVRRQPDGAVVRIVGTHFDLTARRRAESERARTELLTRLVFAQEDERRRIAREMHDQFGEHLTALGVRARMLRSSAGDPAVWRDHLDALEATVRRLDSDVDHLVWELRPTALDDLGLRAALENYVHDWSSRVGIAASLHTTGLADNRLSSEAETTLYRIAQEALTNVAKHARARRVEVLLEQRGGQVSLVIEDDGVGFDPEATGGRGLAFGLLGMQERAALVGATLEIESSVGRGTTVLVRMSGTPLARAADHE